jgi:FkbM family methyltransferase
MRTIKRPMVFNLPFSYKFKNRLFFRFFHPVKSKWHDLFKSAPIKASPNVFLKLLPTDFMHGLIAFTGIYEEELTERISRKAEKGGLLVDVGANAGYFSLLWASLNPLNTVMAFEASPRNVGILKENVEMNGMKDKVKLYPLALGKEQGMLPFDIGPEDLTGWGGVVLETNQSTINVEVDRLDNLIADDVVIDVMKVDVEGADTWVIMGAEKLLKSKRIKVLYFEQNKTRLKLLDINEKDASEYLESMGYRVRPMSDETADVVDWVAVPENEEKK